MWDQRNREPDVTQGIWSELSMRLSSPLLLSDWSMWGFNATHRQWFPLNHQHSLIFAYRVGGDLQSGELPFFHQSNMGGSQWVELGGNSALRGYPVGRFRGQISLYLTQEIRWRLTQFTMFKRETDLMLVPFIDLGRVYELGQDHDWIHFHGSGGIGGRLIYDQVFVVRVDFAIAAEEIQKNAHSPIQRQPRIGIYAIVGHTF